MQKGMTYILRPAMERVNFSRRSLRMAMGSAHLLVGPAWSGRLVQMKVRSSTRATSDGSERARKELGRFWGFSRRKVPWSQSSWVRVSHSACEPSHQMTWVGVARVAISSTHV